MSVFFNEGEAYQMFDLKNVNYETKGQVILRPINLSIPQNAFIVVSGPSGSGKSTLLKILGGLVSYTDGILLYNGKQQKEYNMQDYRKEVSYFFQTPVLFGETVRDNLKFPYDIRGLEFDETHVQALLNRVGLSDFMNKGIHEISGGEKQRVALIRNVVFMPKVLLLDEVTSALDIESKEAVWNFVNYLYKTEGLTIISVTHHSDEIQNATHRIIIEEGSVTDYESEY